MADTTKAIGSRKNPSTFQPISDRLTAGEGGASGGPDGVVVVVGVVVSVVVPVVVSGAVRSYSGAVSAGTRPMARAVSTPDVNTVATQQQQQQLHALLLGLATCGRVPNESNCCTSRIMRRPLWPGTPRRFQISSRDVRPWQRKRTRTDGRALWKTARTPR